MRISVSDSPRLSPTTSVSEGDNTMHTALGGRASLADLADVEGAAVVELGQTKISLQEARRLTAGDTITLTRLAGEPYRVSINDHPFGEGEAVVVADQICLRLTRLDPTVEDQHGSDMPAPSDRHGVSDTPGPSGRDSGGEQV